MKNATKHADELKSHLKKLLKEFELAPKPVYDPIEALTRGALAEDQPEIRADEAMTAIRGEFVELNELRVSTELEVAEIIGLKYPDVNRRVTILNRTMNYLFEKEHVMSMERFKTLSKKDARVAVRELPDITPFVEGYVMLFAFDAPAVPMDEATRAYLLEQGILEPTTDLVEAQKFVENQLKAEECYPFFAAIRYALFDRKKKKA